MAQTGPQTLGALIKSWRTVRSISARELAAAAQTHHSTILRIESGAMPSSLMLWRICRALELDQTDRLAVFDASGAK
jgi:transcriptional regulator with XRE-family HTH domain